jgi:hypothetical protein
MASFGAFDLKLDHEMFRSRRVQEGYQGQQQGKTGDPNHRTIFHSLRFFRKEIALLALESSERLD